MKHLSTRVLGACLATGMLGCTGPTVSYDDVEDLGFTVPGPDDPVAPHSACDGVLVQASERHFENLATTARSYFCVSDLDAAPAVLWAETATRSVTDFQQALRDDRRAFRERHHSLEADLRRRVELLSDRDLVDVTVWFGVDESDVPDRETLVASGMGPDVNALLAERMRDGARAFLAKLDAASASAPHLPRPELLTRFDPDVRLGAPRLELRVPSGLLEVIGAQEEVGLVATVQRGHDPHGEAYFQTDVQHPLDNAGWDGNGIRVAVLEWGYPESMVNLDGLLPPADPSEACTDSSGVVAKCHCAGSLDGFHPRGVAGIIRSKTTPGGLTFGGMADQASVLFANFEPDTSTACTRPGEPDSETSAVHWALAQNAHVINFSYADGWADAPQQDNSDRFFDYVASHWPFPLVVASAGNSGCFARSANRLLNGVVVGGSNGASTPGNRSAEVMWCGSSYGSMGGNYVSGLTLPAHGWELPHVVALADNVATAGIGGSPDNFGGTSAAAPQVSSIAAAVYENNAAIRSWPEATIAGLLVGANENVDEASSGVWPMRLDDFIDDLDGAGLVNAQLTFFALEAAAKKDGGNVATNTGHDYGNLTGTAPFTYYSESWNAQVAPGATLRAAAVATANVSCGSSAAWDDCTSPSTYPLYVLEIREGSTLRASSFNTWQNYQFASFKNTTATTKTYSIKVFVVSLNAPNTFGMAWSSR